MGNPLATGTKGEERGDGGGGSMVRTNRRPEHRTSSVAVREFGGEEGEEGDELGRGRVGRYGAQDRAADSDDEVEDIDAHALESRCIKDGKGKGGRSTLACILGICRS